jgi:hypothetical protein
MLSAYPFYDYFFDYPGIGIDLKGLQVIVPGTPDDEFELIGLAFRQLEFFVEFFTGIHVLKEYRIIIVLYGEREFITGGIVILYLEHDAARRVANVFYSSSTCKWFHHSYCPGLRRYSLCHNDKNEGRDAEFTVQDGFYTVPGLLFHTKGFNLND